jgi:hypothetical protein
MHDAVFILHEPNHLIIIVPVALGELWNYDLHGYPIDLGLNLGRLDIGFFPAQNCGGPDFALEGTALAPSWIAFGEELAGGWWRTPSLVLAVYIVLGVAGGFTLCAPLPGFVYTFFAILD